MAVFNYEDAKTGFTCSTESIHSQHLGELIFINMDGLRLEDDFNIEFTRAEAEVLHKALGNLLGKEV